MSDTNISKSQKGPAVIHALAFIVTISLNAMAVLLPLNGKSTGELSDQYPNLFTPAGLTFSIWSVIYLFLLGFIIYQFIVLFKQQHPAKESILNISKPFIINCLANASWIIAWHYEQVLLSVGIMFVILITLIMIHERLRLSRPTRPLAQKLFLDLPFSFYLGWISIATIANITALLVNFQLNLEVRQAYLLTVIMICIGTLLNMFMVLSRGNIAFGLVGIWAFIGIVLKRQAADGENTNHIIFSAQLGISLIVVAIILQVLKYWRQSSNTEVSHVK